MVIRHMVKLCWVIAFCKREDFLLTTLVQRHSNIYSVQLTSVQHLVDAQLIFYIKGVGRNFSRGWLPGLQGRAPSHFFNFQGEWVYIFQLSGETLAKRGSN